MPVVANNKLGVVWSDIDPRFIQDAKGDLRVAENVEAVYSSIDNILRTRKSERVMLRNFGCGLTGLLAEPMNNIMTKLFVRDVKLSIETWDDRVTVVQLNLTPDYDNGSVSVAMYFQIKGYGNQIFQYMNSIGE